MQLCSKQQENQQNSRPELESVHMSIGDDITAEP